MVTPRNHYSIESIKKQLSALSQETQDVACTDKVVLMKGNNSWQCCPRYNERFLIHRDKRRDFGSLEL